MATVLMTTKRDDEANEYKAVLDPYEMSIIIDAVRRHVALQKVELEELIEGAKANAGESDWRDSPDIYGLEEMISRAETMLIDFSLAYGG